MIYYIQNGYVGNAVCWWRPNSRGYTTDLESAGKYTEAEALKICERVEDVAWPCSYIDGNLKAKKVVVDGQYLDSDKKMKGGE